MWRIKYITKTHFWCAEIHAFIYVCRTNFKCHCTKWLSFKSIDLETFPVFANFLDNTKCALRKSIFTSIRCNYLHTIFNSHDDKVYTLRPNKNELVKQCRCCWCSTVDGDDDDDARRVKVFRYNIRWDDVHRRMPVERQANWHDHIKVVRCNVSIRVFVLCSTPLI